MSVICSRCGRDIDAIGQDNVSYTRSPICEDCADRCGDCVHYVGGGDWGLCCKLDYGLHYEDSIACFRFLDRFEVDAS